MISYGLVSHIPRLEGVAKTILHIGKSYYGIDNRKRSAHTSDAPAGSRLIQILYELVRLEGTGLARSQACVRLLESPDRFDPEFVRKIQEAHGPPGAEARAEAGTEPGAETPSETEAETGGELYVELADLRPGDMLVSDVVTLKGKKLIGAGHEITAVLVDRLRNFDRLEGLEVPLVVKRRHEFDPLAHGPGGGDTRPLGNHSGALPAMRRRCTGCWC